MAESKEKKMSEKKPETKKETPPAIEFSEVTLKQKVTSLDTGEEIEISFPQKRFTLAGPESDESRSDFLHRALTECMKLVTPVENQVQAFLNYATSQSYQNGRNTELAKGNYLTSEIRSGIVKFLSNVPQYAELSAKDAYARWLTGFKAKKPGALKVLEIVSRDTSEFADF